MAYWPVMWPELVWRHTGVGVVVTPALLLAIGQISLRMTMADSIGFAEPDKPSRAPVSVHSAYM